MSNSCQAVASLSCTTEARQRVKACPHKCLAAFGTCRRVGVWLAWISSKLGKVGPAARGAPHGLPPRGLTTGRWGEYHGGWTLLTPLGVQPTSGEVPLECSWQVGIHMPLHGACGLPPRCAGSIRAWARRHRAVDPPRSPQARIIDLHGRARRPSSCRCGSASRRVATPPPLSTDRRPRWWGHGSMPYRYALDTIGFRFFWRRGDWWRRVTRDRFSKVCF